MIGPRSGRRAQRAGGECLGQALPVARREVACAVGPATSGMAPDCWPRSASPTRAPRPAPSRTAPPTTTAADWPARCRTPGRTARGISSYGHRSPAVRRGRRPQLVRVPAQPLLLRAAAHDQQARRGHGRRHDAAAQRRERRGSRPGGPSPRRGGRAKRIDVLVRGRSRTGAEAVGIDARVTDAGPAGRCALQQQAVAGALGGGQEQVGAVRAPGAGRGACGDVPVRVARTGSSSTPSAPADSRASA